MSPDFYYFDLSNSEDVVYAFIFDPLPTSNLLDIYSHRLALEPLTYIYENYIIQIESVYSYLLKATPIDCKVHTGQSISAFRLKEKYFSLSYDIHCETI